jgi:hypothetical protein
MKWCQGCDGMRPVQYVQRGIRVCGRCVKKTLDVSTCVECGAKYSMIDSQIPDEQFQDMFLGCPCYDDELSATICAYDVDSCWTEEEEEECCIESEED